MNMPDTIHEPISVITVFNHEKRTVMPKKLFWKQREYIITKIGYHHQVREGRTLFHIFHVTDGNTDFRLLFNTESLHWTLEEVISQI